MIERNDSEGNRSGAPVALIGVGLVVAGGLLFFGMGRGDGPPRPGPTGPVEPVAAPSTSAPPTASAPTAAAAAAAPSAQPAAAEAPPAVGAEAALPDDTRARVLQGARSKAGRRVLADLLDAAERGDRKRGHELLDSISAGAPEAIEVRSALDRMAQLADDEDAEPALVDVSERLSSWQRQVATSRRHRAAAGLRTLPASEGERFVAPGGKMKMKKDGEIVERKVDVNDDGEPVFSR
jgi:hypothetical protein